MSDKRLVVVSGLIGPMFGDGKYDTISSRHFVVESTAELDAHIATWRAELAMQNLMVSTMLTYIVPSESCVEVMDE